MRLKKTSCNFGIDLGIPPYYYEFIEDKDFRIPRLCIDDKGIIHIEQVAKQKVDPVIYVKHLCKGGRKNDYTNKAYL